MRTIGAKKAHELRAKQHFQQRAKSFFFIRLVAVAAERFATLDRVGDVLGHVAQLGEFRQTASAGDMRVDEPSRHQPEAVYAARFFVRRLMGGSLLSNRLLRLIEGGVALSKLGLKRGNLGLERRNESLLALCVRPHCRASLRKRSAAS